MIPRRFFFGFVLFVLILPAAYSQSIVQMVPLPATTYWNAAWGLDADENYLYISSNTSDATNGRKIITLDHNGNIIDSLIAPAGIVSSQGLAREPEGNFYYLRRYTNNSTIVKIAFTGELLDSLRLPSGKLVGGLAFDGEFVWFSLYSPNNEAGLYKLDFANKVVVDTILVPTQQPYGMSWDGEYLYYVENGFDGNPRGIHKVDPATGNLVTFIPEPQDQTSNGTNPRDVAWDGQYLWLLAEPVGSATGRRLYKYDPDGPGTPIIQMFPSLLDFGGTRIDSTGSLNVSIYNTGTADLVIDSVRVMMSSQFSVILSTPLVIDPGGTQQMAVQFSPTTYGSDTASIRIYSSDPIRPVLSVAARGLGLYGGPFLAVPASHQFGSRRAGSSNIWQMTLQNLAGQTLNITSISTGTINFSVEDVTIPFSLDSLEQRTIKVWYYPTGSGAQVDTLRIHSNAFNAPVTDILLTGTSDVVPVPLGVPLWQYTVPPHPVSNTFRLVKAVRSINDITGDGKPEIVISTENYWTMVVNGNASGTTDSLWAFTTYVTNSSAGSIGTTGDYSHQKALAIASDLNRDGFNDIVIGTGGGNERVYALDGLTGQVLWSFGTDHPDSFGLGDFTGIDVARDFNGDGIPDVVAAAAATQSGGTGGRRSIYVFDGSDGSVLWQSPLLGFTHAVSSIPDIDGDGIPDAIGTVGEPTYKASAFSGANGSLIWDFNVPSSTGGAKELMLFPIPDRAPDVILGAFWGPVYRLDGESGTMRWSSGTNGNGVLQIDRLPDINGDGIDEVLIATLGAGARCLDGANGQVLWTAGSGNTMGIARIPDLNQDGFDEVAIAVQNQGILIVRGNDGFQLTLYPTGTNQSREIAVVEDMDGNKSFEIIMGGREANVALLSGGLDAGPTGVGGEPFIPDRFVLHQNYPNPFNPSTMIQFETPMSSHTIITIYDLLGRKVRTFDLENLPPGSHHVVWDGRNEAGLVMSSGVYFYQLRAGTVVHTRTMMFLK